MLRPIVSIGARVVVAMSVLWGISVPAHAALFEDEDARRAILDLRRKLEVVTQENKAREATFQESLTQLQRTVLELSAQNERLRNDLAELRGQNEQVAREVVITQGKQKALQQGVEERVRKLEPIKVTVDGRTFNVDPEEKRLYDQALNDLKQGDDSAAIKGFTTLNQQFSRSGYRESAMFWLGNAYYSQRNYKDAINAFKVVTTAVPAHPKAAEALLSIANCQIELKDTKTAKKTLEQVIKDYPKTETSQTAQQRLTSLK